MSILIKNGLVLTLDPEDHVFDGFDVLIEGNRITKIEKAIANDEQNGFDKVIDASNKLVMPGLVNAHFHSYDLYRRGLYENLPLEVWLPIVRAGIGRELTQHEIHLRTLLASAEMIRNGITTAHDHVILEPWSMESIDTVMGGYKRSGIRAVVGASLMDKPPSESLPFIHEMMPPNLIDILDAGQQPSSSEQIDLCKMMINKWNAHENILYVALAPSAPQRCSEQLFLSLDELSREYNVPIGTHVVETKVQVVAGQLLYSKSIIEYLADLELLSDRLVVMHAVWATERDIELLAEAGSSIVHNPVTNLRLGSGIAPVRKMLNAGINVSLGCDNFSANDAQNIFEAMKFAAVMPEIVGHGLQAWEPARSVLSMATINGARSVGLQSEIATLEVGKMADIILLDLESPIYSPLNDPVRQIVYAESGRSVDTVLVNGKVVLENKHLVTMDEFELFAEVKAVGESLSAEFQKSMDSAGPFLPYLQRIHSRCMEQEVGMSRILGN